MMSIPDCSGDRPRDYTHELASQFRFVYKKTTHCLVEERKLVRATEHGDHEHEHGALRRQGQLPGIGAIKVFVTDIRTIAAS